MVGIAMLAMAIQAAPDVTRGGAIASEVRAVCKTVLCRPAITIRLKRPDGTVFESAASEPSPIVTGGLVTILPGETVHVEARVEGKRLVDLKAVSAVTVPERTLTFHLAQEPSIGDGSGMILTVESRFPGALKYRMGMMLLDSDRLLKTSSCPARSGTPVVEHWPHPIFQIVATDFRLVELSSDAGTTCE